ncbi:Abi family protein [Staphylococcus epidermidis]|uniref:Abi family protein n=1 Tax=Staphylococcus epidermidis TaxID=1282 RepID=UPI0002993A21|nr:Abi family protein [Staphylococcus epidermidis]EKS31572.1 hypothetical protein HMPREF9281_01731 [Staphylococcus epidermidis BVS058A4]
MRNIEAIETLINTSKYSKPYLSYEEQLLLLKYRGIKIEDEKFALRQLETISYYSLINAYTPLFLNNDNEYENGVTFNDFHLCYKYDTRLKNILFKYIILIEQSLKTNLSSIIAKNYGVQEPTEKIIFENKKGKSKKDYNLKGTYLDAKNYDSNKSFRSGHLRTIANFRDYKKNNSIIHYREKHNHVPPWILIRPLNFGQTIKWLSILKPKDKHEVLLSISPISVSDTLKEVAIPMFEIFRQYRNVIAHGQRFYSFTSDLDTAQLSLNFINNMLEYEFMDKSKYKKGIGKNDIYSLIISIMIFTKAANNRENLVEELLEIYEKMEKYCKYNLFNVIGIEKIDIEKLWVLNRLLKCL